MILAKYSDFSLIKKRIYLFTLSSHSEEFIRLLNDVSRVECIIDYNSGKHGEITTCGRKIKVLGPGYLYNMSLDECTFVITDDYYKEIFDNVKNHPAFANYKGDIFYFLSGAAKTEEKYRQKYEKSPLNDIIVFRSGPHMREYIKGADFSDNARVLFLHMLSVGLNKKYRLVWIVKDPEEYLPDYSEDKNVEFIAEGWSASENKDKRDCYYSIICTAKFFFFTDAYGIGKYCRKDQVRVQLWHGCGFKNRLSTASCKNRYEYMTVTGPLYKDVHAKVFGLSPEQLIDTGIPKGDLVIKGLGENGNYILKKLGVPNVSKYILWLPTYRTPKEELKQSNGYLSDGEINLPLINSYTLMSDLNQRLKSYDIALMIKLHPFQEDLILEQEFSNITVLNNNVLDSTGIHINSLMNMTSALISDYSSAAVDYLALNRPLAFSVDDIMEYKENRGFVFEPIERYLPGKIIGDFSELLGFVEDIARGIDREKEKRESLRKQMNPYDDGRNCERIIKVLSI